MRVQCLTHVPFEGLGSIAPWLAAASHEIVHTRLYEQAPLPAPEQVDLLVVIGGPMSVHAEEAYPWLAAEKRFIREVVERGKPVLGICLGAQLIANALGAKVYRNPVKEIGWFPIRGVPQEMPVFSFPPMATAFHWHGETFDLPPGAIRLAGSEACENQAFQLGNAVIGLQFHLETTPESARDLVAHCGNELVSGEYVQNAEEILAAGPERYHTIHQLMDRLLVYLTRHRA